MRIASHWRIQMTKLELEDSTLITSHGSTHVPDRVPVASGTYALVFRGDPGSPSLNLHGGAMVRIGSATRDITTRMRALARIIRWDGYSDIRGDLRSGGLPDWLASLPRRPKPEDFALVIACGEHAQYAERLTYDVAWDLAGSPPPANRCRPGVYQKEKLNWLAGRKEGGFGLTRLLLGDPLVDNWLAMRGRA